MDAQATWRRKIVPACPNCGRQASVSVHRGCKGVARDDDADLYVDVGSGRIRCEGCGKEWDFGGWEHHCTRCDAVYEGGEIWQGMAAEMGNIQGAGGDLSWLNAAGITRGTLEITFLGWSSCRACRRRWNQDIGWLKTGTSGGGLCTECHDAALSRFSSTLKLFGRAKTCSFCSAPKAWRLDIVTTGKAAVCEDCSDIVWRQREA